MHLDLRHLRTLRAIHDHGGLARAAEVLHITQSALSHQIKGLEEQAGVELFVRRAKPLRLSAAGLRLLRLAQQVLPLIDAAQAEFRDVERGRIGRLHVGMECPACLDWLIPVMDLFRRAWPEVDLDIRQGASRAAVPALIREEVDLILTTDPEDTPGLTHQPLFDYAAVAVVAAGHPLATHPHLDPADLAGETVIHAALDRARLDVFAHFLDPAGVTPAVARPVDLPAVALMLAAGGRGVAVLPDWVARRQATTDHVTLPLGPHGLRRRLYAAIRDDDLAQPFMAHALRLMRTEGARVLR